MRNAVFLAGIWVGIIIFAYGVVYWGSGPTEIPYLPDIPFTETVYVDPAGQYEVTLPPGWAAQNEGALLRLVGPEREIQGSVSILAGDDPEAAVADAWALYRPDAVPSPERVTVGSLFDTDGPDWHVAYRLPDAQAAVAAAYATEGSIAVLIVEGPSEILEKRAVDIGGIRVVLLQTDPELETPAVLDEEVEEVEEADAVAPDSAPTTEQPVLPGDVEASLPADDVLPQPDEPQTASETIVSEADEP